MPVTEILCTVCGASNQPGSGFCSRCGARLTNPETGISTPANTSIPDLEDQQPSAPGDYKLPKKPVSKPRQPGTTRKVLLKGCVISGGALTVVLCAVMTVFVYTSVFVPGKVGQDTGFPWTGDSSDPSVVSTPDQQGGLIEITTLTPVPQTYEGIWNENECNNSYSGGMATLGAAVVFENGRVYFGLCGDSYSDIVNNSSGAGIPGGSEFDLTPSSLIIYTPAGDPVEYLRDGTTWWAGDSTFTPAPGYDGGKLVDKH